MIMRKGCLKTKLTIICFTIVILSGLAFALDEERAVRVQGLIMELDLKKNIVVVNEKAFVWNQKTVFHNENGAPIDRKDRLQLDTWVYIEGEWQGKNKPRIARDIYFLPRYIGDKEKSLYPFIQ
jgi:hypothetical protein